MENRIFRLHVSSGALLRSTKARRSARKANEDAKTPRRWRAGAVRFSGQIAADHFRRCCPRFPIGASAISSTEGVGQRPRRLRASATGGLRSRSCAGLAIPLHVQSCRRTGALGSTGRDGVLFRHRLVALALDRSHRSARGWFSGMDAAEMNDGSDSRALVMPSRIGCACADGGIGLRLGVPRLQVRAIVHMLAFQKVVSRCRGTPTSGASGATIPSMCLSLIFNPCRRIDLLTSYANVDRGSIPHDRRGCRWRRGLPSLM